MPPRPLAFLVGVLLALAGAHESCCAKAARLAKLRHIPDPDAEPPDLDQNGAPRLIPNATAEPPEGWDDEDDGPWEPPLVENPLFAWKAPLIPNPDYNPPTFLAELASEVWKALPWVVLGTLVTAALEVAQLPMHALGALLRTAGPLGGALVGLATPLCSCGALPVAAGFVSSGVPLRAVVAFLTASQSAGLDSVAITWGLLGPQAALCRLGGALLLAVAAGLVAPGGAAAPSHGSASPPSLKARGGALATAWAAAVTTAAETFPAVLIGLGLSAAAVHWLPSLPQAHDSLADGLPARLALLGAALPLQLCEHSTVTAAAAIQKAGGAPGLAFAFLLSAPATNLPSLLLRFSAQRQAPHGAAARFAAARVALALTATALLLSYAVDAVGVDLLVEQEAAAGGASMLPLPEWLVQASPWLAALLACAALAQALGRWARPAAGAADACCDAKKAD